MSIDSDPRWIRRRYRYRLYPTKAQIVALEDQLAFNCDLWNAALEQRRDAWRRGHERVTLYDQHRDLTGLRSEGGFAGSMGRKAQCDVLHRLDLAFRAFYRRCQAGEAPGYPRFKSKARYDSLTWPEGWGAIIHNKRLRLKGIGLVCVRWHREIPASAEIKAITVKRSAGRWYVCLSLVCEPREVNAPTNRAAGIDMGITTFATLSTGERIEGPRPVEENAACVRRAARKVSRRKHGSNRRRKAMRLLARHREHERNVRRDHAHKTARDLVRSFDFVAVEDLQIRNMTRSARGTLENPGRNVAQKRGLNRTIHDQAWGQFLQLLTEKAEEAARVVVKVNPAFTSQTCAECGARDSASRKGEQFRCTSCGHADNADVNAARNILARALADEPQPRSGRDRQALTQDEEVCVA